MDEEFRQAVRAGTAKHEDVKPVADDLVWIMRAQLEGVIEAYHNGRDGFLFRSDLEELELQNNRAASTHMAYPDLAAQFVQLASEARIQRMHLDSAMRAVASLEL